MLQATTVFVVWFCNWCFFRCCCYWHRLYRFFKFIILVGMKIKFCSFLCLWLALFNISYVEYLGRTYFFHPFGLLMHHRCMQGCSHHCNAWHKTCTTEANTIVPQESQNERKAQILKVRLDRIIRKTPHTSMTTHPRRIQKASTHLHSYSVHSLYLKNLTRYSAH